MYSNETVSVTLAALNTPEILPFESLADSAINLNKV
jgi:hypothetical protein